MRSPKVNKSKFGKVTLMIPMEHIEVIDAAASYYQISIEEFIRLATYNAIEKAKKDIERSIKRETSKLISRKPVAKKPTVKKAATKKKAQLLTFGDN